MRTEYKNVGVSVAAIVLFAGALAFAGDIAKEPAKDAQPVVSAAPTPVQQPAAPLAGEQIKWQVISSGGTNGASASYHLRGTAGQVAVGMGSSAGYILGHGFWQPFGGGGGGCCQQRGDVNDDGTGPDISDLVDLVGYMFGGQPYPGCIDPPDYKAESDINGDFVGPDISDLVALVSYMFGGCPSCLVPCP